MSYAAVCHVSAWTTTILRDGPSSRSKGLTQCLWGDWVGVKSLEAQNGWLPVRTRGRDGWLRKTELMPERPLEVNFVDIGQGDGTFVVTPDDRMLLIDAGQGDNMHRFLRWRFNLTRGREAPRIHTAIITHPDQDHYKGFQRLFDDPRFRFARVLHNGIVERTGADTLGPSRIADGQRYLTGVVRDRAELNALLSDPATRGRKLYPRLLWTALQSGRVDDVSAVSAGDTIIDDTVQGKPLTLKVLAPVLESLNGQKVLRWFGDEPSPTTGGEEDKTKNGHSVVTMLQYGKVRIMLGGDLNLPAEEFLMQHYGAGTGEFAADVAKACHHGSADFSTRFLDLISPVATVISSGDDEPHGHPRADTLGTVGKHSRGDRALIFSTELARSAPERITAPSRVRAGVLKLVDKVLAAADDASRGAARTEIVEHLQEVVQRSVSMYGLITLRTDGERAIVAQRLEQKRSETAKWDVYPLERENDVLVFKPKH